MCRVPTPTRDKNEEAVRFLKKVEAGQTLLN